MKKKISITIEEDTVEKIQEKVVEGIFRNKSHALEYAMRKLLEDE